MMYSVGQMNNLLNPQSNKKLNLAYSGAYSVFGEFAFPLISKPVR